MLVGIQLSLIGGLILLSEMSRTMNVIGWVLIVISAAISIVGVGRND